MDKEQIKKALDAFENDEFTTAKEIIGAEIQNKRNEFLKDKLELKESIDEAAKSYTLEKTATQRALKSLQAILKATKNKDGEAGEIFSMALDMKKSYDKNKGFSKGQAEWIYKTSNAMFNK